MVPTKDLISNFITSQRATAKILLAGNKLAAQLETEIRKDLASRFRPFGKVDYYVTFVSGSSTETWDPHIRIDSVRIADTKYIRIENDLTWYAVNPVGQLLTKNQLTPTVIDFSGFNLLCTSLEAEFGVPVRVVEYQALDLSILGKGLLLDKQPRNQKEALIKHGGEIIKAGTKPLRDWDVPNYFIILRDPANKLHVYFSTDGNGTEFTHYATPESKNLDIFFDMLEGTYEKEMTEIFGK